MSAKLLRPIHTAWCKAIQPLITPGLKAVTIFSLTVTGLVVGAKQLGWLQPLELRTYDCLVRLRTDEGIDPRLLVVAVTERDIQELKRSTPSDADLALALGNLEQHNPRVIGLDLHRDVPQEPGTEALHTQLQTDNIIVITKLGNEDGENTIPPPPDISSERVGFNDLLIDPDGVIRRNLLFGGSYFSFSLRVSLKYLESVGIFPEASDANPDYMQLGNATFTPLNKNSGGYQFNDDRGYQILLNYRSHRHVARQVTFGQVLRNEVNQDWINDKIVLIGTTAVSGKDLFYTPYSAGEKTDHQMSGVEVHAQMVSQLLSAALNQRPLMWFWTEWAEWIWIGGWALTGGYLAWRVRHPLILGIGSVGLLLLLAGSCFAALTYHGWVPLVAPSLSLMLAAGAVVTHRAQQAHRQQQMVMTLLGQNTSPEIADALWESRDRLVQSGKLPGQRLTATMLFTDIKDFSSIAERMSPEELLDWLNEYLEVMTQSIQSHHGIVNKFTGDGLMAIFGVPVARLEPADVARDAAEAVACALEMSDRLSQLNESWQKRGLSTVQMRVGIFTGPVVAGSLGGKDRMEYGVIGDSVNIAARLEGCAKERQIDVCRVLIARETLEHLHERFEVESWGPMALKGKQQPIDVYRVLGHKTAAAISLPNYELKNRPENSDSEAETKANSVNL